MSKIFELLMSIPKTVYMNLKYFELKIALKMPIFVSYNVLLKQMNGEIVIDSSEIKSGMIKIGFGEVGIFDKKKSKTIWEQSHNTTIIFKGKANIGHGSKISVSNNSHLLLGHNLNITAECAISCSEAIEIGDNCLISWETLIMDSDFHQIFDLKTQKAFTKSKEIIIGDRVWIGCRSTILKGSVLSNDTIVGAGSLISRKYVESNIIIAGSPGEKIKEGVVWKI